MVRSRFFINLYSAVCQQHVFPYIWKYINWEPWFGLETAWSRRAISGTHMHVSKRSSLHLEQQCLAHSSDVEFAIINSSSHLLFNKFTNTDMLSSGWEDEKVDKWGAQSGRLQVWWTDRQWDRCVAGGLIGGLKFRLMSGQKVWADYRKD